MTYTIYAKNRVENAIKDMATVTSYRHLSQQIKRQYPKAKMSPSKLCRIANGKQEISASDIAIFVNVFHLQLDDFFTTFPF